MVQKLGGGCECFLVRKKGIGQRVNRKGKAHVEGRGEWRREKSEKTNLRVEEKKKIDGGGGDVIPT